MKELKLPCHYLGTNVVQDVIHLNQKHTNKLIEFMHLNAISQSLPIPDIVLCREVLVHLSLDDGLKMIQNI
jgi:chemotaxis methyl-accepting protein methylase